MFSVIQSYLTLCDPLGYSPSGSSVHGISQASILEWVDILFSRGSWTEPGIEPVPLALQVDCLLSEPQGKPSPSAIDLLEM